MPAGLGPSWGLPAVFSAPGTSSFTEFLSATAPELLPGRRPLPPGLAVGEVAPHGTTIVAIASAEGVVMAGDRRATMGYLIASRDIEKVHAADTYSLVGIAGTAAWQSFARWLTAGTTGHFCHSAAVKVGAGVAV